MLERLANHLERGEVLGAPDPLEIESAPKRRRASKKAMAVKQWLLTREGAMALSTHQAAKAIERELGFKVSHTTVANVKRELRDE